MAIKFDQTLQVDFSFVLPKNQAYTVFSLLIQTIQFQLNRGEYGIPDTMQLYDVQFDPSDYGII